MRTFVALPLLLVPLAYVACSPTEDAGPAPALPAPDGATSTTGPDGGPPAAPDRDQGDASGDGSGPTLAGGWSTCAVSDALPAAVDRARVAVAYDGTTTSLYVAIDGEPFAPETAIRRYVLSSSPRGTCVLTRDPAFGAGGALTKELGPTLGADDKGGLWTLSDPTIVRLHPTTTTCAREGALSGLYANTFVIDGEGANGVVQFEGLEHSFGRLSVGATCTIAPLTFTGAPAGNRYQIWDFDFDAKGRLHTVWPAAVDVEIYDAAGAFQKQYRPDEAHPYVRQVARCGAQICVLSMGTVAEERALSRCDAEGTACETSVLPLQEGATLELLTSRAPRAFALRITGAGAPAKAEILAGL